MVRARVIFHIKVRTRIRFSVRVRTRVSIRDRVMVRVGIRVRDLDLCTFSQQLMKNIKKCQNIIKADKYM